MALRLGIVIVHYGVPWLPAIGIDGFAYHRMRQARYSQQEHNELRTHGA